jgi:hypothetical protein
MYVSSRKVSWSAQFLFVAATCCTKISILLFYRRVASGSYKPWFKYTVWFSIAFVAVYAVVFELVLIVECRYVTPYHLPSGTTY